MKNCTSNRKASFPEQTILGVDADSKRILRQPAVIEAACFGIAGPVVDGRVKTTNLPWIVDTEELRRTLKLDTVNLLNDLEAGAHGLFTLEDDEFFTLNEGEMRQAGNKALIAAGTGLGQAILYDDGRHFRPLASEGGHGDFAPRDELEIELLRYLMGRFGHVSYERVVSGPGLFNIYRFLKDSRGMEEPGWLAERFAAGDDPGAIISKAALAKEAEICVKALDMLCRSTALKPATWRCAPNRCAAFTSAAASRQKSSINSKMEPSCAPFSTKGAMPTCSRPYQCRSC